MSSQLLSSMADMATLIRQEQKSLFGSQCDKIVNLTKQYNDGMLLEAEFLAAVAATYAQ